MAPKSGTVHRCARLCTDFMRHQARPPPAAKFDKDALSSDEETAADQVVEPPSKYFAHDHLSSKILITIVRGPLEFARKRTLAKQAPEHREESLNDDGEDSQAEPYGQEDEDMVEERDDGSGDIAAEVSRSLHVRLESVPDTVRPCFLLRTRPIHLQRLSVNSPVPLSLYTPARMPERSASLPLQSALTTRIFMDHPQQMTTLACCKRLLISPAMVKTMQTR